MSYPVLERPDWYPREDWEKQRRNEARGYRIRKRDENFERRFRERRFEYEDEQSFRVREWDEDPRYLKLEEERLADLKEEIEYLESFNPPEPEGFKEFIRLQQANDLARPFTGSVSPIVRPQRPHVRDLTRYQQNHQLAPSPIARSQERVLGLTGYQQNHPLASSLVTHPREHHESVDGPHLVDLLDHSLINSHVDISPWTCAKDWIDADVNHITSAIQMFVSSTQNAEIEHANFGGDMIYQHLIVYIFAHLMFCTHDKKLLSSFKETLVRWRSWDFVTRISNQQQIKDYLLDRFQRDLRSLPRPELHPENIVRQLLRLDAIRLCARLTVMVTDNTQYKLFVNLRGPPAQAVLNLLQARLDVPVDPALKRRHVKALIRLSRATGLYPECLVLKGIEVIGDAVGGGGFADIFKGRLRDQEIAVKMLKVYQKSDIEKLLKEFSSEAVTWRQLSHPNVLPFYGVFQLARNPPRVCLACPWMENGNLARFLADRAPNTDCVPLSLDVALGLEYLHGEGIIHGDLKAANILVSPSRRACLADFGLATARDSKPTVRTYMSTNRAAGTLRWQAPELLLGGDDDSCTTLATDVYAFAMVCYEMFSGTYPYDDITNDFKVMLAIQQGKRPAPPSHHLSRVRGWSSEILHLIEACWTEKPSERLSVGHIVETLRALPGRPVDERPMDTFNNSFASQVSQSHPFSMLVASTEATAEPSSTRA